MVGHGHHPRILTTATDEADPVRKQMMREKLDAVRTHQYVELRLV
jgi:hypothetical protein